MDGRNILRFDGKIAIVTGSTQGVGLEYARLLAERGATVVINGRSADRAIEVVNEIMDSGGSAMAVAADLSDDEGAARLVDATTNAYGRLDILVNNAGVSIRKNFEDVTVEDFDFIIRANIHSDFFMTQRAWPHMVKQKYGRIINTTSGTGLFGTKNNHHYAASKGAVAGFTRSLSIDSAQHNIFVNAVAPMAATRLANNIQDEDFKKKFFAALPPSGCAGIVAWLAHENCSVNGEIFDIGGGHVSRVFTAKTEGYLDPELTPEDVEENLARIMDETNYAIPTDGELNTMKLLEKIAAYSK